LGKSTTSIEIEASPEKVFAFIISEKMNDVTKDFIESKLTSAGPIGVGSTVHYVGVGRNKGEWDAEVTEFVKNKKLTMRTIGASKRALNSTNSFTLEPTTKGTKVTYSIDYEMPYSILGKLIDELMVSKNLEKSNRTVLENLKKALEA
jgi:carbon monoxide dehydrogenase subunit G